MIVEVHVLVIVAINIVLAIVKQLSNLGNVGATAVKVSSVGKAFLATSKKARAKVLQFNLF